MPQVFKVGSYWVYFWANENDPLEPVHVHVCQGAPNGNATKIWITRAGGCILCNNNSRIPDRVLRNIISDEAAAYFAGEKSLDDTANMIQSRVNLYVAEQS